jgi:hypothetical protein
MLPPGRLLLPMHLEAAGRLLFCTCRRTPILSMLPAQQICSRSVAPAHLVAAVVSHVVSQLVQQGVEHLCEQHRMHTINGLSAWHKQAPTQRVEATG